MSFRFAVLCWLCLAIVAGCRDQPEVKPAAEVSGQPLTIGLVPEHNIFKQMERYTPLARYLSRQIGRPVELKILERYGNIIDNFAEDGLDGAFFGSFTGALAQKKLGVEVVARPVGLDNSSTYYGMIFARIDSGIKTAADMQGKRFVFVDKATTAGYLLPLQYFRRQGIADYSAWFQETYFAGTHEDAIYDVLNKKADVGAAKNTVFYRLARVDNRLLDDLHILAKSPEVPDNALALRSDLDDPLKRQIKKILLEMHKSHDGLNALDMLGAIRFIETNSQDYQPVFDYAAEAGLDLATYDYLND